MTRRALREHCFKVLFCTGFYPKDEDEEQILAYFEQSDEDETSEDGKVEIVHAVRLNEEEEQELKDRVEDILNRLNEIDGILNSVAEGWALNRMGRVELNILRLAVYEIKFDEHVPDKVAINEAVELAKKFGGDESPAFVNGVLAKLV